MAYNPIVVPLASLKVFFFNGLEKALHFSDNIVASDPRNPIRAFGLHQVPGALPVCS
jgi:hypothetical protein